MPIKQELDPEELLREAEEQAGDDGTDQVACTCCPLSLTSQISPSLTEIYTLAMLLTNDGILQLLLDAKGLKRLILSFERKVSYALSHPPFQPEHP